MSTTGLETFDATLQPSGKPLRERHREQFLAHIQQELRGAADIPAEAAARAVFLLLTQRITAGEIEDVRQSLPPEIRMLWPGVEYSREAELSVYAH